MAEDTQNIRKKHRKRRFYQRKTFWLILLLPAVLIAAAVFVYADIETREYRIRATTYDLEKINDLEIPSIILDRSGNEIGRIFVQNRSVIPISEVSDLFIDALRAGEDSRFLKHKGIDYIGVVRALKLNWEAGTTTQGASTITQQLARNAFPLKLDAAQRGESGIQRKLVEAFLARRIEARYSKPEILSSYLNRIYFGSGFYGLRSASLGYFGKEPAKLSLPECATIVGLIKNPTNNSPLNDLKQSRISRDMVLSRMAEEGFISSSEKSRAQASEIELNPRPLERDTSHLYERIADAVTKALGEDALSSGGFTIHTTISAPIQNAAEEALEKSLTRAEARPNYRHQRHGEYSKTNPSSSPKYLQGALFMVDHQSGEVLAHVGGRDYTEVPYDFIELGRKPLGTAFFPFIYSAALLGKHTLASTLEDEPMDNRSVMIGGREGILGEWGMELPDPTYRGSLTLRQAFEEGKIAATVRLGTEIGVPKILTTASKFGFSFKDAEPLPRTSVGWEPASLKELVTATSTFPLGGRQGPRTFHYIDWIEDRAGTTVYRRRSEITKPKRIVDSAVAFQVHSLMTGRLEELNSGPSGEEFFEEPFHGGAAGGTTHDFANTWFTGYNGRVTCAVWTGFLHGGAGAIYPGAFSRDIAKPIWTAAMNAAAPGFGGKQISPPDSIQKIEICSVTGQRATEFCQEQKEDLRTGSIRSVSMKLPEWFPENMTSIPFCSLHSGTLGPGATLDNLPALDALPIRPSSPVLIGEDPYHTQLPSYAAGSENSGMSQRSTNVLDSLDLGAFEESIQMRKPERLRIYVE